ncbi:MAG: PLP-dependent aspartate aminotransferase family protein [Clostridiaceae bacterium]|jgi:cystathionine beta-lyase/cystathionine gamma-synthase|nr:PLP-dependent aspartate aminotransferase family protein [Clostridiaceae bacterium]
MKKDTVCVHGNNKNAFDERTGAVSVPIYQSATFKHPALNQSTGFDYSRMQNPTRLALEQTVAELEGGYEAFAYSTGMSAIACLAELFSPNDRIIASEDLYGGVIRLFNCVSEKNGLHTDYVDTSDLDAVAKKITPDTKAIFIETPTNPMMEITDIAATAALAKAHGLLLIVDNTFLSPYFQQPLNFGADVVVHSGTKFLCGHNDTLSGLIVVKDVALGERLRFLYKTIGSCLSPFDSWLMLRGIKTLALRMEKQQQSAYKIVKFLQSSPKVKKILYAGIPGSKGYDIMKKQTTGFGSMISFEVDSAATAERVLKKVRLIAFAESLGGTESLITYPTVQTHADVPLDEREKRGINDRLLRLSVGIENAADLIADLKQAIGK